MATYTSSAGDLAVHAKTTAANTVDTVTLTGHSGLSEIICDGAADLYFTADGSTPTVAGANTYRMPAGSAGVRYVQGGAVIKLISAGAVTYSVSAA